MDKKSIISWKNYSPQGICYLVSTALEQSNFVGIEESASGLQKIMELAIDKLTEHTMIKSTKTNRWYSRELKSLKQKRDRLYKKFITTNCEIWWHREHLIKSFLSHS